MTPKRRILPIFVPHLGCPHDCVFCNQRHISGALSPVTAQEVTAMLRSVTGTGYEAAFYGGSFTAISPAEQEALLRALEPYRRSGVITAVRCSTRPDCVGDEALERLKRYGVETVELGIQSLDGEVLRLSGRGHTRDEAIDGMRRVKEAGFHLICQMMTGLPGDSPEKDMETCRTICAVRPDGVRIYPTVVIRDTRLWEDWQRGVYTPQTVEQAVEVCAALWEEFDKAGIPVIRCGLNPTRSLSGGEAAAGAYHPALGELVQARRYRNRAQALLEGHAGQRVTLEVSPGQRSAATGQKRANLVWLTEKFRLERLTIREADIPRGEIRIAGCNAGKNSV